MCMRKIVRELNEIGLKRENEKQTLKKKKVE